jgi:hypothetical protein
MRFLPLYSAYLYSVQGFHAAFDYFLKEDATYAVLRFYQKIIVLTLLIVSVKVYKNFKRQSQLYSEFAARYFV